MAQSGYGLAEHRSHRRLELQARDDMAPLQKDARFNDKNGTGETDAEDGKAQGEGGGNLTACRSIIFENPVNLLLLVVPVAMYATFAKWSESAIFGLNFVAILPLAGILGAVTELLAQSVGDTLGGLLNATFGNAVEMILAVFYLRKGPSQIDVVQGSLLGSILSNLLLVLGMCFMCGGAKFHVQTYNANGARLQAALLLLSVLALVMPSLASMTTRHHGPETDLWISRGAAIILGIIYIMYLYFQLGTHPEAFVSEHADEEEVTMGPKCAIFLLVIVTLLVAYCSDGLVDSMEGMIERCGISRSFIGVILLPIVGNAAEHATAVTVAMKDKMDLSLGVALGSSAQIALFVVPFTVLVGWAMDVPMSLKFQPVKTGIMLLTVLIVGNAISDGESNWLEGAMLLAAYFLVGVTFWFID
mmetsp:Transcript_82553/g.159485  ORF Transcript_82553/g.159485 Transcript_82553/m.159485 type:complete len:417 (+) Transcript_82553:56-1306(+)